MKISELRSIPMVNEKKSNIIRCDVLLFSKLLSYAREETTGSAELHALTQRMLEGSKGGVTLRMPDYDKLIDSKVDPDKRAEPGINFPPPGKLSTEVND